MNLPDYAIARLTRLTYVRFLLDHDTLEARAISAGPHEAATSTMNGEWITAQIEPFKDMHRIGEVPGLTLRLMGYPFNGSVIYEIAEATTDVESVHVRAHA